MRDTKAVQVQNLSDAVSEAMSCINSFYPLTNFIACNALKGLEKIPFEKAMRRSNDLFGANGFLPLSDYRAMYESERITPSDLEESFQSQVRKATVGNERERTVLNLAEMLDRTTGSLLVSIINRQMIKWCGAFLDRTQAQWSDSSDKRSFFHFWKDMARHDLSMWWHGCRDWSQSINELSESSQDTLAALVAELEIQPQDAAPYFRRHLTQLPGFASYLKWKEIENGEAGILADYLAIRLFYEKMLSQVVAKRWYKCADLGLVRNLLKSEHAVPSSASEGDDYGPVWQDAYELNYRNKLLSSLNVKAASDKIACCQMVFCIDVRSEPIRRELEQLGPYSTYGFAGFFAMPMRLKELGSAMSFDLCPVLLKPEKEVCETASVAEKAKTMSWQALDVSALQLKKRLKCSLAGAFGLVELLGLWSSIPLLAKTFFPELLHRVSLQLDNIWGGKGSTKLDSSEFSLDEKTSLAEGALNGIGFTHFGKVMVFCGHKSSSVNNPYASSLDCGACGGNAGGFSARLAADVLNDQTVRAQLAVKGIRVPDDTLFIAAEHDTTTDLFTFYDAENLSEDHHIIINQLKDDLSVAGTAVRSRRAATLPQSCLTVLNNPLKRSHDWAQIAPEWGLAGNAAFLAAPRSLSKDSDLEGRVFLHSYQYENDSDRKVLELIMTAPLVVAQWINIQYYLSTMDNKVFGSGSKVLHNVIGDFGVMQGAQSDLKIGLPLQSVMASEGFRHEPMRLLAIIRAPLTSIDDVLNKYVEVRNLVSNRWIRLIALDPLTEEFYEADDVGKWRQIKRCQSATSAARLDNNEFSVFA